LRSFFLNVTINQYVFCGNNPVNFRDPFGLAVDLNLVDPDDPAYEMGAKIDAPPGSFSILVHGEPGSFSSTGRGSPKKGQLWSPIGLARLIYEKIKSGQDVYLYSCEAAKGGDESNIQEVANFLDILIDGGYSGEVHGPTTTLLVNPDTGANHLAPGVSYENGKIVVEYGKWLKRGQNRRP
jgi:hypothetical protein